MLLIGCSTAYYLVVYIPARDKAVREYEVQAKAMELEAEEQLQIKREEKYNECIAEAKRTHLKSRVTYCKNNGIQIRKNEDGEEVCSTTKDVYDVFKNENIRNEQNCMSLYRPDVVLDSSNNTEDTDTTVISPTTPTVPSDPSGVDEDCQRKANDYYDCNSRYTEELADYTECVSKMAERPYSTCSKPLKACPKPFCLGL